MAATVADTAEDSPATAAFRAARDFLLNTPDPVQAHADFVWPQLEYFNWATDWFDAVVAKNTHDALWICTPQGDQGISFTQLRQRSDQVAAWFQEIGFQRGDRVLILLRNSAALYEVLLAAIKIGVVVIPSYITISPKECLDRVQRGSIAHLIAESSLIPGLAEMPSLQTCISVGSPHAGWLDFAQSHSAAANYQPIAPTRADEALFGYFTSGTTSLPKLALHTHTSYPIGHLSGMYWNGVRPGDAHLNVSNPGWAKHAWSSFFVPWNAEASIIVLDVDEIKPEFILDVMRRRQVSSCCAPTTVWRMLARHGLGEKPERLRQLTSAGEPLQVPLFETMKDQWGLEIRDGYGQTEATALIGNAPGTPIKAGSMGRALPGYDIVLVNHGKEDAEEGEVCIDLRQRRPIGLMTGYDQNTTSKQGVLDGPFYHTGDFAKRDADGYISFIGRMDDVFKSYDYRISPFELERVMLEFPAIAEIAVVPSPDPMGLVVPKAFICLNQAWYPCDETAQEIGAWMKQHLPPEFLIRRLSFVQTLPKTASGKVKRAQLRDKEGTRVLPLEPLDDEYFIE